MAAGQGEERIAIVGQDADDRKILKESVLALLSMRDDQLHVTEDVNAWSDVTVPLQRLMFSMIA